MPILLTGSAGFIGFHVACKLLEEGKEVVGVDSVNNYYDVSLKESRLKILQNYKNFTFIKADVSENIGFLKSINSFIFDGVIHLAAQAGVRYSLENPQAYIDANITGFLNVLEFCKDKKINNIVYASSSSVYGNNSKTPFEEIDPIDEPASLYAATKIANEKMAKAYSNLYGLRPKGLRFFTVYGPWGRPDMAPFLFVDAIKKGREIKVFNDGNLSRDFTYVDDVVEGVIGLYKSNENEGQGPKCDIYNIGCGNPTNLMDFISEVESALGVVANKKYMPMQKGDVETTFASKVKLDQAIGFSPSTKLEVGVPKFVRWYEGYYRK